MTETCASRRYPRKSPGGRLLTAGLLAMTWLLLVPQITFAQAGIAGVVRDSSGGVLPGVTVEASSPALIEKARTVVTDGEGLYKIIDLRPGAYTVAFTLAGFAAVRREGIVLTGSFTATVNADLRVGSIEETLTVSGQAPVVDVSTVAQERVLQRDVIDALPTGNRDVRQLAFLIPGVVQSNLSNVGGVSLVTDVLTIHASRSQETQLLMDGMPFNHGGGVGGARSGILVNDGAVEEMSIQVGGGMAESPYGTLVSNVIPKSGGNTFAGVFQSSYANGSMQADNITDTQKAQGIKANGLKIVYDATGSFGGALKQDKLWYYTALRKQLYTQYVTGVYFNKTPTAVTYTPDLDRPAYSDLELGSVNLRLTWQATPKNKVTAFYDIQHHCECYAYKVGTSTATPPSPEASYYYNWIPDYMWQTKWTSTVSSRLLLEAGASYTNFNYPQLPQRGVSPDTVSIRETSTGFAWRNYVANYGANENQMLSVSGAASYVTGSHALKVGTSVIHSRGHTTRFATGANAYGLNLLRGVPISLTQHATPLELTEILKANVGVFAQDQWRLGRLTLNLGARFDYWNSYVPAHYAGQGPNVPTRDVHYDAVPNVPVWKNLTPRLGFSYDVFGTGKTAIKGSLGQFVFGPEIIGFTRAANPLAQTSTSSTRAILNGSFTPNCDFTNPAANGDCGQLDNRNFGKPVVQSRYDPSVIDGNRGTNWEGSASIQHELIPSVSVSGAYFRRSYQNLNFTENLAVTAADFDSYCITAPSNPRLPDGGGYQICGLYDIKTSSSSKFGVIDGLIQLAPDQTEVYNGFDFNLNARLPRGVVLSGGTSTGRNAIDQCFKLDHPEYTFIANTPLTEAYCDDTQPFKTQVKAYGVYPVPLWGIRTSATFRSVPGPQISAFAPFTSAEIASRSTLGRRLTGGRASVSVNLVPPGEMYGDTVNQVDWRLSKNFTLPRARRLNVNLDVYNVLNASQNLRYNNNYGSQWQYPNLIVGGRLLKVSGQFDF